MVIKTTPDIYDYITFKRITKFWGKIIISFEKGKITHLKEEKSIKITDDKKVLN
jgi:hypothetical protein